MNFGTSDTSSSAYLYNRDIVGAGAVDNFVGVVSASYIGGEGRGHGVSTSRIIVVYVAQFRQLRFCVGEGCQASRYRWANYNTRYEASWRGLLVSLAGYSGRSPLGRTYVRL